MRNTLQRDWGQVPLSENIFYLIQRIKLRTGIKFHGCIVISSKVMVNATQRAWNQVPLSKNSIWGGADFERGLSLILTVDHKILTLTIRFC